MKVNQTKFSSFNDDHTDSAAPPTNAIAAAAVAASNRTSRVEGKKHSVEKKKAQSSSKEPHPSTISLKDAMDQVSCNRDRTNDHVINLKLIFFLKTRGLMPLQFCLSGAGVNEIYRIT